MANRTIPVFSDSDITANPLLDLSMSSSNTFSIQLSWTGLTGSAVFKTLVSLDGSSFDSYPVIDKDGNRLTEIPISGASGSLTLQSEPIVTKELRFEVDGSGASAGTVSGIFVQIDNQDTY